jgi:arsenate reductase
LSFTIYHNSRCGKSRQTLALLEEKNITPTIINYLETPPSKAELKTILTKLGLDVKLIIRFKEDIAKEININKNDERSFDEWLDILVSNPKLIERPIVVSGNKAVLGRPPENVLHLID